MEVPAFQLVGAVLVGGIIQAIKQAGLESRFAPIASLAVGVCLGLLWSTFVVEGVTSGVGGAAGLIAGLTASGLYSGQKALREE